MKAIAAAFSTYLAAELATTDKGRQAAGLISPWRRALLRLGGAVGSVLPAQVDEAHHREQLRVGLLRTAEAHEEAARQARHLATLLDGLPRARPGRDA